MKAKVSSKQESVLDYAEMLRDPLKLYGHGRHERVTQLQQMDVVRLIATVTTAHRRLAKLSAPTDRQTYTQTKREIAIYCLPARRGNREGRTLSLDTRDLRGGDARSHSSSLNFVLNDRRKGTLFCAALPGQQTDIIKKSFLPPLAKGRRLRTDRECLEDRPKEELT